MDAPKLGWKERLTHRNTLIAMGAGLAVGALGAFGGYWVWLKPQRELARLRFDAMNDVLKLYGLQTDYMKAHGSYAGDLETLLASSGQRDAVRARLAAHVDLNTITVVDEGAKFKIEVNVLDKDRTLMKIKGPPPEFTPRAAPKMLAEPGRSALPDPGAPVLPPNGR
ncbi:MAG: hypothetical protein HY079_07055 [Elusimicrobia bacterium]|nr:hypothetical protein [Elusimicrobiota bacterium]